MLDCTAILLSHWLAGATHGVNPIASLIPRHNIAGGADYPAPPVVTVLNDTEDKNVAANLDPETVPALVVWGDSDPETMTVKGYPIAKRVTIAVAYVTEESEDPLTAIRDCGVILRAARVSLFLRYNSGSLSEGFRELNGIKVLQITSVSEKRITGAVGRRKLWGFLSVNATVVETIT